MLSTPTSFQNKCDTFEEEFKSYPQAIKYFQDIWADFVFCKLSSLEQDRTAGGQKQHQWRFNNLLVVKLGYLDCDEHASPSEKGKEYLKMGKKHYWNAIDCYTRAIKQQVLKQLERSGLHIMHRCQNLGTQFSPEGLEISAKTEELKKLDQKVDAKFSEHERHEIKVFTALKAAKDLVSAFQDRGLKIGKAIMAMYSELLPEEGLGHPFRRRLSSPSLPTTDCTVIPAAVELNHRLPCSISFPAHFAITAILGEDNRRTVPDHLEQRLGYCRRGLSFPQYMKHHDVLLLYMEPSCFPLFAILCMVNGNSKLHASFLLHLGFQIIGGGQSGILRALFVVITCGRRGVKMEPDMKQ
ncbi:hypothetical protein Dimus_033881 [Dionaea muscipula]